MSFVTLRWRLKNRLRWDDALDVWGVHGVGGALGVVLWRVCYPRFQSAGRRWPGCGQFDFFMKQVAAVAISSVWAFVFTYGMLWLIDKVTPVKVDQQAEESGFDAALHGDKHI